MVSKKLVNISLILRNALNALDNGDSENSGEKYIQISTDNCIEFLRESNTDTTTNNLLEALRSVFEL